MRQTQESFHRFYCSNAAPSKKRQHYFFRRLMIKCLVQRQWFKLCRGRKRWLLLLSLLVSKITAPFILLPMILVSCIYEVQGQKIGQKHKRAKRDLTGAFCLRMMKALQTALSHLLDYKEIPPQLSLGLGNPPTSPQMELLAHLIHLHSSHGALSFLREASI